MENIETIIDNLIKKYPKVFYEDAPSSLDIAMSIDDVKDMMLEFYNIIKPSVIVKSSETVSYSYLDYMFTGNLPKQLYLMNEYARFNSIRKAFFKTNLELLKDFLVVINIHADAPLGTYLIHKSLENKFLCTDDFKVCFYIDDYITRRKKETVLEEVDVTTITTEGTLFKKNSFTKKQLELKTIWTITEDNGKVVALTSKKDAWITDGGENIHTRITVKTIEQGLKHILLTK